MVIAGSTSRIHFNLNTPSGPMDLTGANVFFVYRYGMFAQSQELPVQINDAVGGLCEIILTPAQTNDEGQMYYQLRIEFSDSTILKSETCSLYIEQSL